MPESGQRIQDCPGRDGASLEIRIYGLLLNLQLLFPRPSPLLTKRPVLIYLALYLPHFLLVGINFLATDSLTVAFNADGTSAIGLSGFDGTSTGLLISLAGDWVTDDTELETRITELDAAKDKLRTEAKELSNNLSVITARQDFSEKMINTLEDGVANLTNADMNEEGANMLMLQTRQALGTTSLSIASEAAQSVLRLF